MTYNDFIIQSVMNSIRGTQPSASPNLDAQIFAETLFPIASQSISELAAQDPYKRSLLRREKTITLTAGEGVIPDDVLTVYFNDATLLNSANLNARYAYRDYPDFVRRGDRRLGVFTRNGTTLMVIDPNAPFSIPLTATGNRTLVVPCVVVRPALATDELDCPPEMLSDLSAALTNALNGMHIGATIGP